MPFKIVNPKDRVSTKAWSDVDLPAIRRRLIRGLEEGASGVRPAIREVYAVLLSDDLSEAPSTNWKLPHHEVRSNGDVVLNRYGLGAAAGRINQTEAPVAKIKKAANHLARHYRQIEQEIPQQIKDIIGDNSKSNSRYTISDDGKFIDLATGKPGNPSPGSLMVARLHTALQPMSSNACRVKQLAEIRGEEFAQRKERWPEGRDESDKFLFATYRALSAIVINPFTIPIDFSKKGVLKRATRLLKETPFLKDHQHSIDSQVGKVVDTLWDDGEGDMPGGINALVRINLLAPQTGTVAPLVDEGDANSVSVSVWYEWEQSHPDMSDVEFYFALGTEVDDELVRVIVTKVEDMSELSLVWDGADPYAERLKAEAQGAAAFASFAVGIPVAQTDRKSLEEGRSESRPEKILSSKEETDMLEKMKKALAAVFGKEVDEIDEQFVTDVSVGAVSFEKVPAVLELLSEKQGKIDEYAGLLETRGGEIEELKSQAEELKVKAELGEQYLKKVRADAEKFYKLAEGDAANETLIGMIAVATLEQAIVLRDQFRKQADEKVPLTCDACGSEKVSRASSGDTSADEIGDDDGTTNGASTEPKLTV